MIGKIEDFNFRELDHKVLLLTEDPKNVAVVSNMFPCESGDNALLLYGYIDHEAGISFEVLCVVRFFPGQPPVFRAGKPEVSMKLRYDAVNGILYNTDDTLQNLIHIQKITTINNAYHASEIAEWFRSIQSIDPSRHPQYPDDILIWFLKDGEKPEGIWCRVHGYSNGYLTAILLDEPWNDYGYHMGEQVPFDKVAVNDELKAVAVLD